MNKELELEAQSYLDKNYSLSYERTTWQKLHEKTFIAGATSKYVEKQAFEFAKFCLNKAKDLDIHTVYHRIEPTFQEFLKTKQ